MFSNRITSKKKGFILIYSLVIGLICISLGLFSLQLTVEEYKYNLYIKQYIFKADDFKINKEYLLTNLNKTIKNILIENMDVTSNNILDKLPLNFHLSYNNSYIHYDNEKKEIYMVTKYREGYSRKDILLINIIDKKARYKVVDTIYY